MIKESTIYGGLYWNIVKVSTLKNFTIFLDKIFCWQFWSQIYSRRIRVTFILELIKKEGEEAAKKKKEILAERITPLPTLNGMSKSSLSH